MADLDLWRAGYEAGRAAERRTIQGETAAAKRASVLADLQRIIQLLAQLPSLPGKTGGIVPSDLPPDLLAIAERDMPCTCLPDYAVRGRIDPMCRHDDRDALVRDVVAYLRGDVIGYLFEGRPVDPADITIVRRCTCDDDGPPSCPLHGCPATQAYGATGCT
jgi:hypothetical protein